MADDDTSLEGALDKAAAKKEAPKDDKPENQSEDPAVNTDLQGDPPLGGGA